MTTICLTVSLFLLAAPPINYQGADTTISGQVIHVASGDQLTLQSNTARYKIRLFGVDAPEVKQPYGEQAGEYLAAQVLKQQVNVRVLGRERTGWLRGIVYLRGRSVNERLVGAGLAWNLEKESGSATLKRLQRSAQKAQQGLWADAAPTAPWDWRSKKPVPLVSEPVDSFELLRKQPVAAPEKSPTASPVKNVAGQPRDPAKPPALKPVKNSSGGVINIKPVSQDEPQYWLNLLSGVRHNEKCRNFRRSANGRFCTATEGKPCPHCGG